MRIRNDIGHATAKPKPEGRDQTDFDRVLYACPQCGRNHLVALDCPPADAKMRTVRYAGQPIRVVDEPEYGEAAA